MTAGSGTTCAHAAPCLHDAGAGSVQKMAGSFWAMARKALDAVAAGIAPRLRWVFQGCRIRNDLCTCSTLSA